MCFVFLSLLLAPRPAQAQWTVTDQNGQRVSQNSDGSYPLLCLFTGNGTVTYPSDMSSDYFYNTCVICPDYDPNLFGGPPPSYLPPNYLSPGIGASGWAQNNYNGSGFYWNGTTNEALNGTMTASANQPLTVTFTYTGTGTPPTYLDVLVSGSVSATASVEGNTSLSGSDLSAQASASDGLGESASAQATPSSPSSWNGGQSASGLHLQHLAVSGGKAQVPVPAQFSVTEINLVPCGTGGETEADVNAGVSATVMQDNREVTISSSLGQTYHKSQVNFDHNGVALPDPDTPESDGTVYANSISPPQPDVDSEGAIIYYATASGSWAPGSSYHWHTSLCDSYAASPSPYSSSDGTFTLPGDPPLDFDIEYSSGTPLAGKQEHAYIHLTDASDGANGTANYYVQFHNLTESWVRYATGNSYWQGATADSIPDPGYALHNAGITGTWEYTDTFWAQAGAAFSSVGGNMVPNAYWAGFLAAASIAFSQVQPKQVQQTVNFNDAWTDSNSTFDPKPADNTAETMELYKMVPELYVQYQPQIWRGDAYAASGYTGGTQTAIDKFLRTDTAGDFTLATSDPTGG